MCYVCFVYKFSTTYYLQIIYEALTGHRVSWKKALQLLNERFSEEFCVKKKEDKRPCILLIDELDLLVTRNQSVSFVYEFLNFPDLLQCVALQV